MYLLGEPEALPQTSSLPEQVLARAMGFQERRLLECAAKAYVGVSE